MRRRTVCTAGGADFGLSDDTGRIVDQPEPVRFLAPEWHYNLAPLATALAQDGNPFADATAAEGRYVSRAGGRF
jgi:hypothetical protein